MDVDTMYAIDTRKPLTILFDADDTIVNLLECWTATLNERYHLCVSPEDITDWDISKFYNVLTPKQVFSVLEEDEIWNKLEPIPGSQYALQKLYDKGHDLYMVTATNYKTCEAKMNRIFELFPFLNWEHVIIAHNKQMIKGDVLIDDAPHNLIDGDYLKILLNKSHNKKFDCDSHEIIRTNNWNEICSCIRLYGDFIQLGYEPPDSRKLTRYSKIWRYGEGC